MAIKDLREFMAALEPLNEMRTVEGADWDLEIHCDRWTVVRVCTVQEEHGGGKRCVRVRYRLRASGLLRLSVFAAAGVAVTGLGFLAVAADT